jgi:hypothetical protein
MLQASKPVRGTDGIVRQSWIDRGAGAPVRSTPNSREARAMGSFYETGRRSDHDDEIDD